MVLFVISQFVSAQYSTFFLSFFFLVLDDGQHRSGTPLPAARPDDH